MSSKYPKKQKRRIGFQLAAWYSAILALTFALLFIAAFLFLHSSLKHRDRAFLKEQLIQYATRYNELGFDNTIAEEKFENGIPGKSPFFLRISNPANHTLYLSVPPQWEGFDLTELESRRPGPGKSWLILPKKGDEDVIEVMMAVLKDGNLMEVGMSTGSRNEQLERFWEFAAILLPIALIGILAGLFLSFRALRPIHHLITTVHHVVDTGEMDARVPVRKTDDELADLATLFNRMFERVNTLIHGMTEALDNVAHDLRTPLMRLQTVSEEALDSPGDVEKYQEALVTCLEESHQVISMLNALMDISEAEAGTLKLQLQTIDASDLIREVVDLYQDVVDDKRIHVSLSLATGLTLLGDRIRIRQALANLIDNALKYTPEGGDITITSEQSEGNAVITVRDSGVGINANDLPKIWDRLYRGDQSRSTPGLGLGLSVVKAIARAHRGIVTVSSTPTVGSIFSISLPLAPSLS